MFKDTLSLCRAAALAGSVLLLGAPALGAVIHVDAEAAPEGDGLTWATAKNDLRAALLGAQSGDVVFVKRGVYHPTTGTDQSLNFRIKSGVKVYGGFAGTETSIEERPEDPDPLSADPEFDTILSGEIGGEGIEDNTYHVLEILGPSTATLADRLVLTRGTAPSNMPDFYGGGIRVGGPVTIRDCLIIDNAAPEGGGAGLGPAANGATFEACVFRNNHATGGYGGGAELRSASVTFIDCVFLENTASTSGGGLSLLYTSSATLIRCRFEENFGHQGGAVSAYIDSTTVNEDCVFHRNSSSLPPSAANGGAIYNNSGNHVYRRCVFTENTAQSGGALVSQNNGVTTIENCEFRDNWSDTSGGAISNSNTRTDISDTLFIGNESGTGGAIAGGTRYTVLRCTFEGNSTFGAANYGGALYLTGSAANSLFQDCRFNGNVGRTAGVGYLSAATLSFDRCEFLGNSTQASGGAFVVAQGSPTFTNCVIARTSGSLLGGVMYLQSNVSLTLINCTVVNNTGANQALYTVSTATVTLANTILRNPGAEVSTPAQVTASYCNVEGGLAGEGNIDVDPMFVDPMADDYSLAPGSLCIDAGNSALVTAEMTHDLAGGVRIVDDPDTADTGAGSPVVDIGAYEVQVAASPQCMGDANGDGMVNLDDITCVIAHWGAEYGPESGAGDADGNTVVDFDDITSVIAHFNATCD